MAFDSNSSEVTISDYEKFSYGASDQILTLSGNQNIDGSILPTVVPTLGGIIRSLQPVQIAGLTTGYGPNRSTRDDTMVGGNGTTNLSSLLSTTGLLSMFNAANTFASGNALSEGGFGDSLLGGITETVGEIANSATRLTNTLNYTLGSATQLANMVTLGHYQNTGLAKSINRFQNNVNQNTQIARGAYYSSVSIQTTLNNTVSNLGSLLNFRV